MQVGTTIGEQEGVVVKGPTDGDNKGLEVEQYDNEGALDGRPDGLRVGRAEDGEPDRVDDGLYVGV